MGMLANRLRKNAQRLGKWIRKNGIECYRLYQQDIPEYPLIVDRYGDCAVVWANERKRDETYEAKIAFLDVVSQEVSEALNISPDQIFLKSRQPGGQYRRIEQQSYWKIVSERELKFYVNLANYHDTGLFLDHRPTRQYVRERAQGKDLLNLFCYTGSFTVYAAIAGARSTTSIDLSGRYLDWLDENLILNKLGGDHLLVRSDVMEWLERANKEHRSYDIIVCDPPTFSNSKRTENLFDIVRDHTELLEHAMALLRPEGFMIFSNNKRGFKLDKSVSERWECKDITSATTDPDFMGKVHHQAWLLRHRI